MPRIDNTEKFIPHQQYFQGGATTDFKMGIANSYYSQHNFDGRTFPSQMSVLPASRAINSKLSDLILAMDQDLDGVRYGVGSLGNVYRIDVNNDVSRIAQMTENGSAGLLYSQITDQLYIPGQTTVSMYGQLTNNNSPPQFRYGQFGKSASIAPGCTVLYNASDGLFDTGIVRNNAQIVGLAKGITAPEQVQNSFSNTYLLPASISESPNNLCFFQPDIEPFYSIAINCATPGTGNWTLTLHDSLNNQLASTTIANASIVTGWNEFVFASQVRAFVNAADTGFSPTYHFHLTSSMANDSATIYSYQNGDISGANFLLFASRMVQTNNGWHPTCYFTSSGQPLLCIGNGEYLSIYNFGNDANPTNAMWQRHALTFKPGYEVCGLSINNQYLVIACERRSNDSSRNAQDGCLYFWDGSTSNPNFLIDIPQGSPYGLTTLNNVTYMEVAGSLFAWSGGQTVLKVRRLAYQNTDYMDAVDQTRLNPNSMTSRYNILMMGYPSSTTDPNIDYGIWSWGAVELTYPNSYNYSYSQSPAPEYLNYSSANQLQQGCCVNFVDSMYSSWAHVDPQGNQHYGLDVIDNFSDPATWGDYSSLIFDGGVVYKEKMAVRYKIYSEALPTGYTLTPWWIIDRGTIQYGDSVTAGATECFVEWNNARFHELQWGFSWTQSGATEPAVILGVAPEIDPLSEEIDLIPGES